MSWDVIIVNTRGKTPPLDQLQESDCEPLGPVSEVRRQISAAWTGVEWNKFNQGHYVGDGFGIEISVRNDDPCNSFMLHVRGGGDVIAAIVTLARQTGWSAIDCSTSEFLDLDNPSQAGWEGFQNFRDKVMEQYRDDADGDER